MDKYDLFESERRREQSKYHRLLSRLYKDIRYIVQHSDSPQEFQRAMDRYIASPRMDDLVNQITSRMATMMKVGHKKTWRAAAAQSSRGKQIYQALRSELSGPVGLTMNQIIADNSLLIRTVPRYIALQMSKLAQKAYINGLGNGDIMARMRQKAPHLTDVQIRRIARTETSKAATALSQARCEQLGLQWYEWYSCKDQRVRSSHARMHGIICNWADPPAPEALFPDKKNRGRGGSYHAGKIYNCRCIPLPIFDENDLHFPVRVHVRGKIVSIGNVDQWRKLNRQFVFSDRDRKR